MLDAAWDVVEPLGTLVMYGKVATIDLENGLTFGQSWAYGDFDIPELIAQAELIDGLAFARIEAVIQYKTVAARPKDLAHLELVAAAGLR